MPARASHARRGAPLARASPHSLVSPFSHPNACPPHPLLPGLLLPLPLHAQCHGTKTLRRRPGYLRTRDFDIVDDTRDSYLCFYCGPHSRVGGWVGGWVGCRWWWWVGCG